MTYTLQFERFWDGYPLKQGKLEAYRVWRKQKPPVALVRFALLEERKTDKWRAGIVEWPKTWLLRQRYLDYEELYEESLKPKPPAPPLAEPTRSEITQIAMLAGVFRRKNTKWSSSECYALARKEVLGEED